MTKAGVYVLCGVLAAAALTVAALELSARPTPRTVNLTTVTANGVGIFAPWNDSSDPANPVGGFIQLMPIGGNVKVEPSYMLFYGAFNDNDGSLIDYGQGYIPASAVSVSGGSVTSGTAVIKLNVNTCMLPVTEFQIFNGDCGTIEFTFTETSGFYSTTNGTTTTVAGKFREVSSGTTQNGSALGSGNLLNFELSSASGNFYFVAIEQFSGVSVQITRP